MDQVRIGVIGTGGIGATQVKNILQLPNCRLTAVCDWKKDKMEPPYIPSDVDVKKFTDDDDFFAYGEFDAVMLEIPHYQHVPLALRCLEEGKHVLIEKPVAVDKKTALQLLAAAKKYPDLRMGVMFNQRTIPAHKKLKELIESGEFGVIRRVNWIMTDWFRTQRYYDSGDWRATWRGEGGGVLINQCPHHLDLMQWLFGMPKRVTAVVALGKYHDIEVEDDVTAILEYPNGATGVFIASTGEAPGTNRLEVTAERGRVILENGKLSFLRNEIPMSEFCKTTQVTWSTPPMWDIDIPAAANNPRQLIDVIDAFANSILHGTPMVAEAVEGINSLEIGNAILLSGLKKKSVDLPLDENEFSEMLAELVASSKWEKSAHGENNDFDFEKSQPK